jgi:hypothetical protein
VPTVPLVKVNLPDDVHARAKAAAALARVHLGVWLKAAVQVALDDEAATAAALERQAEP